MPEIGQTRLDDTPVNGQTQRGITSNWAYDHNADVTKHRPVYVNRGDPTDWDFTTAAFTTDETWRDLDLSAIIPAGAIAAHILLLIQDDIVGSVLDIRQNGNSNAINRSRAVTYVANESSVIDIIMKLDSGRIIEYFGSNLTFSAIQIVIKGWFI